MKTLNDTDKKIIRYAEQVIEEMNDLILFTKTDSSYLWRYDKVDNSIAYLKEINNTYDEN